MKKSFLTTFCIIMLAALYGCVKDADLSGNDDNDALKKGIGYIAFSIKIVDAPTTRASDTFNQGNSFEYDLCSESKAHRAFLFCEDGRYFGSSVLERTAQDGNSSHPSHDSYPELYTYAIGNIFSEDVMPSEVLLVLNGNPESLDNLDKELKGNYGTDNLKTALQWISDSEGVESTGTYNNYFTMSNTTFLADDGDTGEIQTTAAIDRDEHIWHSMEEAKEHPVVVYVERVAAKFTILYDGKDITGQTITPKVWDNNIEDFIPADQLQVVEDFDPTMMRLKATNNDWHIQVENWGLNGLERNAYTFKNIVKHGTDNRNISQKFYTGWNATQYHRSYWAVDQHYENGYDSEPARYPDQYRKAAGVTSAMEYGTDNTSLRYISYDDIVAGNHNYMREGTGNEVYKYSLENTFAYESALVDYSPLRYGTHALLAAKLRIDGVNTAQGNEDTDLYYAYSVFWPDPADYMKYAYGKLCASFANGKQYENIRNWETGDLEEFEKAYDKTLYKDANGEQKIEFEDVAEYFTLSKAYYKGGDGMLFLEPIEGRTIYYNTEENTGNTARCLPLTSDQVKTLIYAFTDPVQHFKEGRMYYAIPINHNNTKQTLTNAKDDNGNYITKYDVGDFGVVRNHWYRMNVTAIGNVGTSVDEPDQPIVPNNPDVDYSVGVEIKIIPWRVMSDGNDDIRY